MSSPPCLDVAVLLAPIPGDQGAGARMAHTLRQQLESLRKEFEPHPDNPVLAPIAKKPEWAAIRKLTEDCLAQTCKHLEIAMRLTEALVKLHGFAGLRDGLRLLHDLVEQCWDRVHPLPEDGEGMEVRAELFYWITDPDKGLRFPTTVRNIPLLEIKKRKFGLQELHAARKDQTLTQADVDQARFVSDHVSDEILECGKALQELERVLTERCGRDAPAFTGLRQAIDECQNLALKVSPRPGLPTSTRADPSQLNGTLTPEGFASAGPLMTIATRDEAYRQLAHVADVLEQIEPHSPIPDLLRRAIELGKMPFRQLIRELVREPLLLSELRREFGIKEADAEPSAATDQ